MMPSTNSTNAKKFQNFVELKFVRNFLFLFLFIFFSSSFQFIWESLEFLLLFSLQFVVFFFYYNWVWALLKSPLKLIFFKLDFNKIFIRLFIYFSCGVGTLVDLSYLAVASFEFGQFLSLSLGVIYLIWVNIIGFCIVSSAYH